MRCYSSELAPERTTQSPTTSNWLFEIPPESTSPSKLGVPLPPIAVFSKDTIDWKAVDKIFIKRPKLAKSLIGHGDTGFSTVAFLASLNAAILCKAHCVFEYESHSYFATDGQRLLTKCSLNFNPPDESPLNTVGLSTKKAGSFLQVNRTVFLTNSSSG